MTASRQELVDQVSWLLDRALQLHAGCECRLGIVVWSTGAPHKGRVLECGAAMLHTRLEGDSLRILWSIIAPYNAHGREEAKVWRAASPHNTHMGILTRVWSNISPHKPRTPAWNRRVERQCSTQEIAPNVWGSVAPHMMVKRDIFAPRARKGYQNVIKLLSARMGLKWSDTWEAPTMALVAHWRER